MYIENP